jgi:CRISPR-associated protein Cas6
MQTPERIDLVWAIQGRRLPLDHGYALYAAISRALPAVHAASWLAVHPIRGMLAGGDCLQLHKTSHLTLRLPPERIAAVLSLAGRTLDIAGHPIVIGVPTIHQLRPAAAVASRLVVVRLTSAPKQDNGQLAIDAFRAAFTKEAERQLATMGVAGCLEVSSRPRQIHIGRQRIIGFGVVVRDLALDHSLILQGAGLGGKHRMGCGVFSPVRGT